VSDISKRSRLLIGEENLEKLANFKIAVFGIGGVGGFVVESLVRSGIKHISIFDNDKVSESNINRQIIATTNTVGKSKVDVMFDRIKDISPDVQVEKKEIFYLPTTANEIDLSEFDYIVDAVDTVSAKIELIKRANDQGIKIISCMGTGGKTDPTRLKVTDIFKTHDCPLSKVMRHELKKRGINKLKVIFSDEPSVICDEEIKNAEEVKNGRISPPSMIFVPASAGILIARTVIFDLINN
jgi:tRNA A37 threonylcarbamoyladenosine dehydratase